MTFNPLDLENLGISIASAIGQSHPAPLSDLPPIAGAGIYAVYYRGDHEAYAQLTAYNAQAEDPHPLYVGQAASKGSRKGLESPEVGTALRSRLAQHARSVDAAVNLDLDDFEARWLVLDPVWVNLGETVLIRSHSPVWNRIIDGFGNHDPGAGRLAGVRSRWDVLHPGRAWADRVAPSLETQASLVLEVQEYLRQRI